MKVNTGFIECATLLFANCMDKFFYVFFSTCDDFTCLQARQVDQIIHGGPAGSTTVNDTEIEPLQTGETSHRDGNPNLISKE